MQKEISASLLKFSLVLLPLGAAAVLTAGLAKPPTMLEQVMQEGELVVATRSGLTTYYQDTQGPAGLEYDLARLFAEHLGVDLKIVEVDQFNAILPMVIRREVHLAAAGLSVTDERRERVRFGPAYQEVTQQLVYRSSASMPQGPQDLNGATIHLIAGSSHVAHIKGLAQEYPSLDWLEDDDVDSVQLLSRVWQREIPYTVADSNELQLNQRFYPELRAAFDIGEPQQLAWAFAMGKDDSLREAAHEFFALLETDGRLDQLKERYYGHAGDFDYVGVRRFLRHIDQRLPDYLATFKESADQHDHDWRLLAAVGYQESLWNPRAISPTGVRGIMMLTRATAADMGYQNRIDPTNSIRGGARYLRLIERRLPDTIREPDRTWFTLAAYNIGPGHLQDARMITRQRGGNPDRWIDVMDNLPLLMEEEWYRQTRYGYARGTEAVNYVQNIRGFYDILVWQTTPRQESPATAPSIAVNARPSLMATSYIPSPVL